MLTCLYKFVKDISKCIMIVTFLTFFYRSSVWPSGNVWDAESYYNVRYKHVPLTAPSTPGLQALRGMQWQVLWVPLWCELLRGLQGMISDCVHNFTFIRILYCYAVKKKKSARLFFNVLAMIFWVKLPLFFCMNEQSKVFLKSLFKLHTLKLCIYLCIFIGWKIWHVAYAQYFVFNIFLPDTEFNSIPKNYYS